MFRKKTLHVFQSFLLNQVLLRCLTCFLVWFSNLRPSRVEIPKDLTGMVNFREFVGSQMIPKLHSVFAKKCVEFKQLWHREWILQKDATYGSILRSLNYFIGSRMSVSIEWCVLNSSWRWILYWFARFLGSNICTNQTWAESLNFP